MKYEFTHLKFYLEAYYFMSKIGASFEFSSPEQIIVYGDEDKFYDHTITIRLEEFILKDRADD